MSLGWVTVQIVQERATVHTFIFSPDPSANSSCCDGFVTCGVMLVGTESITFSATFASAFIAMFAD